MALTNTRKGNYPLWYQDVISAADMAEVSSSPGCMVIKPWGYGIWENIQGSLDNLIKQTDHENCYFPLFIPLGFFQKEAEHVEGFAKEMAVVTHSRLIKDGNTLTVDPKSKLEEPLVVRPTSETIIAESFSKWIQSYRDLPLLINQWANIVRWEMRPRLFLRTREFLWQEGHTAHSTEKEAVEETLKMLDAYEDLAQNYLAIPVIKGKKPEYEKFPGAIDTYCIEAMMQDGKALQAGTSHYLGQNFSKSGNITFQNQKGEREFAYTTSWGVSTRLIGGVILTHSDDEGLKVPPRIAPYQIVINPIIRKPESENTVMEYIEKLKMQILQKQAFGKPIRVYVDKRLKKSQDKYWEWTRKGAPIILEIGERDVNENNVMLKVRNKLNEPDYKKVVSANEFVSSCGEMLENIQKDMFERAKELLDKNIRTDIKDIEEFKKYFANQNKWLSEKDSIGFVMGKWSAKPATIDMMKELKISVRCFPLKQSGTKGKCLITGEEATLDAIFARAY
jgi:prolyl-tRNA synthetase